MINAENLLQQQQLGSQQANTIIETRHLTISYGENTAVNNVSLPFKKNSITALIGPSGCGKSTFLRAINRMNDIIPNVHYQGEIIYDDVDLLDKNVDVTALRKEIGMVFQKPNPFAKSVYQNIAHALKFYKVNKGLDEMVEISLRKAALWDEVKDRLHESAYSLSGGQQQRLCIARTLAMKPNVLLLDEPSSALDPIANAKIEELITQLKKHYTIIIVTHNMQQASRISDETAFFLDGRIVEHNETSQLFLKPAQKETEAYISGKFG